MLSAKPVSLLADSLSPPDQAVVQIHAPSLTIRTDNAGVTLSAVTLTSATQGAPQPELSQAPPAASKGGRLLESDNHPVASPSNHDENPPDDQNASQPPTKSPRLIADENSQTQALQGIGDSVDETTGTLLSEDLGNVLSSNPGRPGNGPGLTIKNVSASQFNAGIMSFAPGKGRVLSGGNDAGGERVSSGANDLLVSSVPIVTQGLTSHGEEGSSANGAVALVPVVHSSALSNHPSLHLRVHSTAPGGSQGLFQSGSDSTAYRAEFLRWLSSTWTEQFQERHGSQAAAYPGGILGEGDLPTVSGSMGAVPKVVNSVPAASGIDRGPQLPAYPVGVARKADPGLGAGRGNEWAEKPVSGTGTLANAFPRSEALAGATSPADVVHHDQFLSLGITALVDASVPGQDLVTTSTGSGQQRESSSPKSASGTLGGSDGLASYQLLDVGGAAALFQIDVATAGPVSVDAALANATGSTTVHLPIEESSMWSVLTTYALVILPRQRKRQPTILVVDPDDATRDALNVGLVREGYFVLPAANVHDAWGMLRTPHACIDLVLMDPHLPDVSGIHLCARLREISPALPVMVCAGDVEPAEVAQLRQLGVRYYLQKPIAFEELLHTVRTILA